MSPYFHIFLILLARRPLKALEIAWWWLSRRRVRALGKLRSTAVALPENYRFWLSFTQADGCSPQTLAQLHQEIETWPLLAVHLHLEAGQDPQFLDAAIGSVLRQSCPFWELYITSADGCVPLLPDNPRIHVNTSPIAERAAALAHVLELSPAHYMVPLAADCTLTRDALLAWGRAIAALPAGEVAVFYADQFEQGASGDRSDPWLKPQWDADQFLEQDYLSAACAVPVNAARRAGVDDTCADNVAVDALLARLLLGPGALPARHVPHVAITAPADAWRKASHVRSELMRSIVRGCNG